MVIKKNRKYIISIVISLLALSFTSFADTEAISVGQAEPVSQSNETQANAQLDQSAQGSDPSVPQEQTESQNQEISEDESQEESIIEEENKQAAVAPVTQSQPTINFSVVFDNFNVEDSDVYYITVAVDGETSYVNDYGTGRHYLTCSLTRSNDFKMSKKINCYDKMLNITAVIGDNYTNKYTITIDDKNSGYESIESGKDSYDVVMHVTRPETSKYIDPNEAPDLSNNDQKYFDGSYQESRRQEIKESMAALEPMQERTQDKKSAFMLIGFFTFFVILAIVTLLLIRHHRNRED